MALSAAVPQIPVDKEREEIRDGLYYIWDDGTSSSCNRASGDFHVHAPFQIIINKTPA
jgi:hypothetical protein